MFLFNFGMIGLSFYHSMNKNNHQTFSFNKPKPQTIFLWFSELPDWDIINRLVVARPLIMTYDVNGPANQSIVLSWCSQ